LTHPDYAALVDPLFAFGGKRELPLFVILKDEESFSLCLFRCACFRRFFVPQNDKKALAIAVDTGLSLRPEGV